MYQIRQPQQMTPNHAQIPKNIYFPSDEIPISKRIIYLRKLYFAILFELIIVGVIGLISIQVLLSFYKQQWFKQISSKPMNKIWIFILIAFVSGIIIAVFLFRLQISTVPCNLLAFATLSILLGFLFAYLLHLSESKSIAFSYYIFYISLVLSQLIYVIISSYTLLLQYASLFLFGAYSLSGSCLLCFTDVSHNQFLFILSTSIIFGFFFVFKTQSIAGSYERQDSFVGSIVIYLDILGMILSWCENIGKSFSTETS